jgi:cytochrome c
MRKQMRYLFIAVASALLLIAISSSSDLSPLLANQSAQENTLTNEEKKAGWKLLFDGKTTNGWRGYKMQTIPPGWKVMDGALVRTSGGEGGKGAGGGDDIITVEQYDNFELIVEWKIVPGGNSGVLYRVTEDAETSWHVGPEVQILDNSKHPTRDKRQLAGAFYDLYAPSKDVTLPPGQWNKLRLLVDGNRVEHWLNGEKMVEYELNSEDWKARVAASKFKDKPKFAAATRGHICLQDHSDRVEFRNIKIRPLKKGV